MANLLATKPLTVILNEAHEGGERTLRRVLGPVNLITLGIGAIIGTGIFVITGTATAEHAGPAILFSFIYYHNHWEPVELIVPKLQAAGIDPAILPHTHGVFNLLGFLAIVITTIILVIGIKESANFNSGIVIVKVCVLIIFIVLGASYLMKHSS